MYSPQFAYLEYAVKCKKPFITYRLPNETETITLILSENSAQELTDYESLQNDSGFIFTSFDSENNKSYFIKPEEVLKGDKGFRGDLFLDQTKGEIKELFLEDVVESKIAYKKQFQQMIKYLKSNEIQKVILSRTLTINQFNEDEKSYTFYNLKSTYPQAMVYWIHLPHLGIEWMGATPELLVSQKNNQFSTVALAGTKKPDETWTAKEKEEQQMVAEYIKMQLNEFNPTISETETIDTGAVQHLATQFTLAGKTSNLFDIIKAIHPTPAICGLPQQKALEIIRKTELHQRNYYCGFLGPINLANTTATFVNLRCMQMTKNSVRLYVGGGLTKDSVFEREWQETERKAETLRKFLI